MSHDSWDDVEKRLAGGPRPAGWLVFRWVLILIIASAVLSSLGYLLGWFGEAATVAQQQFGPTALLKKYEWFKDAAAQLDALDANIRVYDARRKAMADAYTDVPRIRWPREDKAEWNLIIAEVAGVKARYNGLAAEYNSQMAKFNYRFTNAGDLPAGGDRVLPREFRPYETD